MAQHVLRSRSVEMQKSICFRAVRCVSLPVILAFVAAACGSDAGDPPVSTALEPATPAAVGGASASETPAGGGAAPPGPTTGTAGESPGAPPSIAEQPVEGSGSPSPNGGASAGEGDTPEADLPTPNPLPPLVRIVSVGDSTTQSTCWRAFLWRSLQQAFPGRSDFVGSHPSDSNCMVAGSDPDNEAYGSALVTEVAAGITDRRTCNPACPSLDDLRARFAATPADVALVHFATNDVWNGVNPGTPAAPEPGSILGAYDAVLDALRAASPNIRVFAAQIIPMNVTESTCAGCTCAECPGRITALNARIAEWAAARSTPESPIAVVDQWTGFDATTDTGDGVHPNLAGSQKMADRWYAALAPMF